MTSFFEGQPPQNKAFSKQNKGHLGSRHKSIYTYNIYIYITYAVGPSHDSIMF